MKNERESKLDDLNALTLTGARNLAINSMAKAEAERLGNTSQEFYPEKRCVDCKHMVINEKRKPYIKVGDTKNIIEMIRIPCDFTLPDGSLGFEPAEVESE